MLAAPRCQDLASLFEGNADVERNIVGNHRNAVADPELAALYGRSGMKADCCLFVERIIACA